MMRKTARFTGILLLLAIGIYATLVLMPRKYAVQPVVPRPGFSYMELSTGSKIAWKKISSRSGAAQTPIIYVHGGPGGFISERLEASLLPLAEMGHELYLYDQVGSGLSGRLDHIREYTVSRHQQDLEAFIKASGASKVILYGHSWGAILATVFTAAHPELVEKLILSGPGHLPPVRKELAGIVAPDSLHLRQPQYTNAAANREANNIRTHAVADVAMRFGIKLAPDAEMDAFQTFLNGKLMKSTVKDTTTLSGDVPGGSGYYAQLMTMYSFANTPDPRPALKKVKLPVLILRGQYDNQKWGYVTEYLEMMPQSHLVIIPDAGHSVSFDQPEMTWAAIRNFLQSQQ
ncbi:MAG TPA: alpha/beta hydrolase [Chitinophagaceae bacterium]|nr:alpha/beta hydrolase [Chitinophagaceae bacterium]